MNEKSGYRNGQLIYPISVLDTKPQEGGGGGGGLGPHTVGHEELKTDSVDTDNIVDGSVKLEDLNQEVKDSWSDTYVPGEEKLFINGSRPVTQEAGAAEDEVEGGGADLDGLD